MEAGVEGTAVNQEEIETPRATMSTPGGIVETTFNAGAPEVSSVYLSFLSVVPTGRRCRHISCTRLVWATLVLKPC